MTSDLLTDAVRGFIRNRRRFIESAPKVAVMDHETAILDALEHCIAASRVETSARPDMYTPWPLHDVLAKLVEATDHLLGHHQCDTHGHEEYRAATIAGREILKAVGPSTALKTVAEPNRG